MVLGHQCAFAGMTGSARLMGITGMSENAEVLEEAQDARHPAHSPSPYKGQRRGGGRDAWKRRPAGRCRRLRSARPSGGRPPSLILPPCRGEEAQGTERHSRESGNPCGLAVCLGGCCRGTALSISSASFPRRDSAWIPAFAGMTGSARLMGITGVSGNAEVLEEAQDARHPASSPSPCKGQRRGGGRGALKRRPAGRCRRLRTVRPPGGRPPSLILPPCGGEGFRSRW